MPRQGDPWGALAGLFFVRQGGPEPSTSPHDACVTLLRARKPVGPVGGLRAAQRRT